MKRVTGIGGIFFKSDQAKELGDWYEKHLGLPLGGHGYTSFDWREVDSERKGSTVWSIFPGHTKYLNPSKASFMINYRVENLKELLETLRQEGVKVDDKIEELEYGKFGWIYDPDGNKIELWEPAEAK